MSDSRYHRVGLDVDEELSSNDKKALARKALLRDALIAVGGVIVGAVLFLILFRLRPPIDRDVVCGEYVSAYESPLLKDVGIKFEKKRFDVASHNQSVYQHLGGEGSGVDEAWEALGFDYARVTLPSDVGKAAGLDGHARIPDSEDYIAFIEVLHQLHCLNMVRQGLYFNIDYYKGVGKPPFHASDDFLQYHLSHCIETIRQQLMCAADFNMFGYVQVKGQTGQKKLFPDYATQHVCRNFEEMKEWAIEHQDERLEDMEALAAKLEPRKGDIVLDEIP
ncbi:hypothetical protein PRZ48_010201 [Zasmidium cellare]|uniref:Tat pathway signal sequence n=1 Tax=Zasmidium cellare TaxID=395010 RepID=A0ABR0EEP9_ZASCE|nr:hypothetical protein PRZ48_010201 [Zasmidium cellare]